MTILRTITCNCCKAKLTESEVGAGFMGWCSINGINFNGVDNPNFCPDCTPYFMEPLDKYHRETYAEEDK